MRRAHGLESDELACCEGRFVPDDDLWEKRLDIGSVAYERNMCEVTPPLAPTHMGHGRWPFLVDEDRTLLIPLEQTDRCFVQVDPKGGLPCWDLRAQEVPPLPRRECLQQRDEKTDKNLLQNRGPRGHTYGP